MKYGTMFRDKLDIYFSDFSVKKSNFDVQKAIIYGQISTTVTLSFFKN